MDLQQAVIVLTDSMGQHVKLIFHSVRWTHAGCMDHVMKDLELLTHSKLFCRCPKLHFNL